MVKFLELFVLWWFTRPFSREGCHKLNKQGNKQLSVYGIQERGYSITGQWGRGIDGCITVKCSLSKATETTATPLQATLRFSQPRSNKNECLDHRGLSTWITQLLVPRIPNPECPDQQNLSAQMAPPLWAPCLLGEQFLSGSTNNLVNKLDKYLNLLGELSRTWHLS